MLTTDMDTARDGAGIHALSVHLPTDEPHEPPKPPPPLPGDEPPPLPEGDPPSEAPPERAGGLLR